MVILTFRAIIERRSFARLCTTVRLSEGFSTLRMSLVICKIIIDLPNYRWIPLNKESVTHNIWPTLDKRYTDILLKLHRGTTIEFLIRYCFMSAYVHKSYCLGLLENGFIKTGKLFINFCVHGRLFKAKGRGKSVPSTICSNCRMCTMMVQVACGKTCRFSYIYVSSEK